MRSLAVADRPIQHPGIRSSTTSLSCTALTNRNGPDPTGCSPKSLPAPRGTTPNNPSLMLNSSPASGRFKCTTTVSRSRASTRSTAANAPPFDVMSPLTIDQALESSTPHPPPPAVAHREIAPHREDETPRSEHPAAPNSSPARAAGCSAHPSSPAHRRSTHPPALTAHPSPVADQDYSG